MKKTPSAKPEACADIVDALLIAQHYVGLSPIINTAVADVDCNGSIDIVDAMLVAQYYVGIISEFPCENVPGLVFHERVAIGQMVDPRRMLITYGIKIDTLPYEYAEYLFSVYYDPTFINPDLGLEGITAGTNGFITEVTIVELDPTYHKIIIYGKSSIPYPGTGIDDNIIIYWRIVDGVSGISYVTIAVDKLLDIEGNTIGTPRSLPFYFRFVENTPEPTPILTTPPLTPPPTPVPTPDLTVVPTPTVVPVNITADLELPTSAAWGGTNHWIPNTGEDFGPFRVKI
ncbi:MAG: hypothetical protein JXJ04_26505, partial [Spirochaetales bacterium]|nr:hypothetical protein [Spirochaetales bacterium]